jgi:predicted NodU family carbamoyl transferase
VTSLARAKRCMKKRSRQRQGAADDAVPARVGTTSSRWCGRRDWFGVCRWHKLGGKRTFVMGHAYWGPAFGPADISLLLAAHRSDVAGAGCTVEDVPDEAILCQRIAAAVADEKVVGWFQGRMEWGPRALGNRSIVCDPRRADMKALLNAKIKRRESFRPFARLQCSRTP